MPVKKAKDPLRQAAILKLSLQLAGNTAPQFRAMYDGVVRDFGLSDADVDRYIDAHRDELVKTARGHNMGGSETE